MKAIVRQKREKKEKEIMIFVGIQKYLAFPKNKKTNSFLEK